MIKTRFKPRTTNHELRTKLGSALIIAVILTSLLAIIGVMFVMIARVDKMSTSAISENKELNFAVEAVVALVSQELVSDVPGVAGQEYYDYPDTNNAWLANLEPYQSGSDYYWRRISDIYNRLDANNLPAEIIADYQQNIAEDVNADADGDGVADSKWIKLADMTSNKGKSIYAAIRVVDNGAMLNVNTAYKFDPTVGPADANLIDGSNQSQINLAALRRGTTKPFSNLDDMRKGGETSWDLDRYIDDVVWQIERPAGLWTPFDISDELKLRNRYILNYNLMTSRIEELWTWCYDEGLEMPRTNSATFAADRDYWFFRTYNGSADPCIYDYRHISTIYNMDRIIDPNGIDPNDRKMTNVNTADVSTLHNSICKGLLDANYIDVNIAAQIAVNIIDYRDNDSNVTVYLNPDDGKNYYGFEQPCVYISEIAHNFKLKPTAPPSPTFPADYDTSYAIELYKPYKDDIVLDSEWQLNIGGTPIVIDNWTVNKKFYVLLSQNLSAPLFVDFLGAVVKPATFDFSEGTVIELQRLVGASWITVDANEVPYANASGWWSLDGTARSIQRDIKQHKCIRRLWDPNSLPHTLGIDNTYFVNDSIYIQAHPANSDFNNVGEIGMLFRKSAYSQIGPADTEDTVRLNLADPCYHNLFQYLTVFDPNDPQYGGHPATETRVKGRININTAPWFVLAQLPWVTDPTLAASDPNRYNLAREIVKHRDAPSVEGFRSIGELMNVAGMDRYDQHDSNIPANDLAGFPDLTPGGSTGDGAPDDFEERDVIFARISNLATVRSDVFTAYILVRIGKDGPQKRVIAILDRSNVYSGDGKVRIIALHPVPDPR
jgi:DNA uptake protein ComE-like DNA-binding protein